MPNHQIIYCFDTSAFIDAWNRYYSPDIPLFKRIWECIETLMAEKRIILSEEVISELKDKDDRVFKFVKRFPNAVKKVTEEQLNLATQILSTHSRIIDKAKTKKNHADVLVIALAKLEHATVVTFEGVDNGCGIPAVCTDYQIPCFKFLDFLKEENISQIS